MSILYLTASNIYSFFFYFGYGFGGLYLNSSSDAFFCNIWCFVRCDLIRKDVALELAWMNNMIDCLFVVIEQYEQYDCLFMKEYIGKVDELIKKKIEAMNEVKAKENEEEDIIKQKVLQSVLSQYSTPDHLFSRVCIIIDKLEKIPIDEMKEELRLCELSEEAVEELLQILSIKSRAKLEGWSM